MKQCPECKKAYNDDTLNFCLDDGTPLVGDPVLGSDEALTALMPARRAAKAALSMGMSKDRDRTGTGAAAHGRNIEHNSIAVLPFINMSAEAENEYFCDGLSEELLNALSHIDGLKVAARTSSFSFKGKDTDISEIARKLGVRSVLEGSVRKSGNRIRISVQLANAEDGYHIWSERYDRELKDIFDIQDEITLAVVDALKLRLLGGGRAKVLKRYTDNTEAYSLYLAGRFFWNKRTTESTQKAIEYYEKAIEKDPNYALAYSGIADAYSTSGFAYDLGSMAVSEVISKAKTAARRALEIDDSLAEAHTSLAYAKHLFDWDWEGAEADFKRALRLNPNYANARHWYAHLLMAIGRLDEALVESLRALELDPISAVMNNHLGWHYMYARDYDAAIAQLHHTLLLDPEFLLANWYLGITFGLTGRDPEADDAYSKALQQSNGDLVIRADAAHFYAVSGQEERARKELDELVHLSKEKYLSSFGLAMINVGLGDDDRAFEYFGQALQEHSDMLVYLLVDPRLDRLHADTRFKKLATKVGLPQLNA
jgi:TolB-like protein/Tfp pilus assembly protein PilF